MALQFTHIKSGRTFAAREGSRLAKLMAKDDGYEPYSEPEVAEVTDVEKMNLAQLKAYADEQGIELTAKKKADVLAEIQAAESGEGDGEPDGGDE